MIRVVIVDGDALARERLRSLMATEHDLVVVGEYDRGRDALGALPVDRADVLFLELALPDISGLVIMDRLRTTDLRRAPLVICVTAHYESVGAAMSAGAFACLPKPFAAATFRGTLRRIQNAVVQSSESAVTPWRETFIRRLSMIPRFLLRRRFE